jgi:hypothetical protein
MLMTEKTVFQETVCRALPIAMNGTTLGPRMNKPTKTKKAICDNVKTNFIVIHIVGFSQLN